MARPVRSAEEDMDEACVQDDASQTSRRKSTASNYETPSDSIMPDPSAGSGSISMSNGTAPVAASSSPQPAQPTWSQLHMTLKELKAQQHSLLNTVLTNFMFSADSSRVFFLGVPKGSRENTLLCVDLPESRGNKRDVVTSPWRTVCSSVVQAGTDALSKEEQLLRERKRVSAFGITSYEMDQRTGNVLFPAWGSLYLCSVTDPRLSTPVVPRILPTALRAARMDPKFCPTNPSLVSFVSYGDIYVMDMRSGFEKRLTFTHDDNNPADIILNPRSAGIAEYVMQEEFGRYTGNWWRPVNSSGPGESPHACILYVEIDEEMVDVHHIVDHSMPSRPDKLRYPRAGTPNARWTLKLAQFSHDLQGPTTIRTLGHIISMRFPWAEYLVRCGWTPEGDSVWAQLLDRQQQHLVLVTIPLFAFAYESESGPADRTNNRHGSIPREDSTGSMGVPGSHGPGGYFVRVHQYHGASSQLLQSPQRPHAHSHPHGHTGQIHGLGGGDGHPQSPVYNPGAPLYAPNIHGGPGDLNDAEQQNQQHTTASIAASIDVLVEEQSRIWINVHDALHFFPSRPGTRVLLWASEETGYRHLYLVHVTRSNDGSVRFAKVPITAGEWQVEPSQVWVDEARCLVYFVATKDSPLELHLYVASFASAIYDGSAVQSNAFGMEYPPLPGKRSSLGADVNGDERHRPSAGANIRRLTCAGFSHSVTMNKECTRFVSTFSSVAFPPTTAVYSLEWESALNGWALPHACHRVDLLRPMPSPFYRAPEMFSFVNREGVTLYGSIYKPPSAVWAPEQKHPTLLFVYGGPSVQMVTNEYKAVPHMRLLLLASLGYVVVLVDGRGSVRRGLAFEGHIKGVMGQVEVADQVEALEHVMQFHKCIDPQRIAIHGWSYGGYLALMGLAQRPDVFKLSIAGAPVTTWEMYDTAYTERYLGLPEDNPQGYQKGSVLNYIARFPDSDDRLLLIHGLIDENVHFSNTCILIDALVKSCKPYRLQVYPLERHGIRHFVASEHYETALLSFLQKYL